LAKHTPSTEGYKNCINGRIRFHLCHFHLFARDATTIDQVIDLPKIRDFRELFFGYRLVPFVFNPPTAPSSDSVDDLFDEELAVKIFDVNELLPLTHKSTTRLEQTVRWDL